MYGPVSHPASSCVRLSPAVMLGGDGGTGDSTASLPWGPEVTRWLPMGARVCWGMGAAQPPGKTCAIRHGPVIGLGHLVLPGGSQASSTVPGPSPGLAPSHSFPCCLWDRTLVKPGLSTLPAFAGSRSSLIVSASPLASRVPGALRFLRF